VNLSCISLRDNGIPTEPRALHVARQAVACPRYRLDVISFGAGEVRRHFGLPTKPFDQRRLPKPHQAE
jgi:hypothetical protein